MPAIKGTFPEQKEVYNQFVLRERSVSLFLKREDLLHPEISGNKFRKLKYNFEEARLQKHERILTFGGAFSNHIAATAAAGKLSGIETIGVIRGEELGEDLEKTLQQNDTLRFAHACGMQLEFISRADYREKNSEEILKNLQKKFGRFYLIPEGGSNALAVKGCEEILLKQDEAFDVVCCAVGTGGTIAGIINSSFENQKVLGFPALKGDFLRPKIQKWSQKDNWQLISDYHFGGYAKVKLDLINFINNFKAEYGVNLDPVYTGKMIFGILDLIRSDYFPENTRILAIHTGGLQAVSGMNKFLEKKNLPAIDI